MVLQRTETRDSWNFLEHKCCEVVCTIDWRFCLYLDGRKSLMFFELLNCETEF
jgi:hypothetical protein